MKLAELSLEELWELFPIMFVDYSEDFKTVYLQEEKKLKSLLGDYIKRISHIGSTAIKNIKTKPIIDILIEIDLDNKGIIKEILLSNSYLLMGENVDKMTFNKGYTLDGYGDNVFHIHIKTIKIVMSCILGIT